MADLLRGLSRRDALLLALVAALVVARRLLIVLLLLLAIAGIAPAQPAAPPPPLFTLQPINGLCGPLWDHVRVLDRAEFEETWRGSHSLDASARLFINREGYWMLLLTFPGDVGCLVAEGPRFDYVGGAE